MEGTKRKSGDIKKINLNRGNPPVHRVRRYGPLKIAENGLNVSSNDISNNLFSLSAFVV